MPNIASALDPRKNSLNALRLMLAGMVVVSHSWPLGGFGEDPGGTFEGSDLGSWAVAGFFVISGYLITASRISSRSFFEYMWRRFLRIYPAFLVALLVVGFAIAPASLLIEPEGTYQFVDGVKFIAKNALLYINSWGVEGTLSTVPFPGVWIVTFWTLAGEFACYVILGLLVSLARGGTRVLLGVVILLFMLASSFTALHGIIAQGADPLLVRYVRVSGFFAAGSMLFMLRASIPDSLLLNCVAVALVGLSAVFGAFHVVGALPLAYLMIYAGAHLPLSFIGKRNDVSYGMYLYSGPVQQVIILAFGREFLSPLVFAVISLLAVIPLAWASWLLVEKPAMRLKTVFLRPAAAAAPAVLRPSASIEPPAMAGSRRVSAL